jgi:transcriptional regulator NrdR family protein
VKCPVCKRTTVVVDSRPNFDTGAIRRRRECRSVYCRRRFSTVEINVDHLMNIEIRQAIEEFQENLSRISAGLAEELHEEDQAH